MDDRTLAPRRAALVGLSAMAAVLLAGCGGNDTSATPAAADGGATAGSTAAESTATESSAAGEAAAPAAGPVSAQEVCDVLVATQPQLAGKGTDDGMITIALALIDLYGEKDAVEAMDGAAIDAMTEATCPEARAAALASAGITSFMQM